MCQPTANKLRIVVHRRGSYGVDSRIGALVDNDGNIVSSDSEN